MRDTYDLSYFVAKIAEAKTKGRPINTVVVLTSDTAKNLLTQFNRNNRDTRRTAIKQYAEDMASGRWMLTGVPLVFSDAGRLIDGQHRLHGLTKAAFIAGKTVEIDIAVVFGVSDAAFQYIDNGLIRSGKDYAVADGKPAIAGTAARFVACYDNHKHNFAASVRSLGTTERAVMKENPVLEAFADRATDLATHIPALYPAKLLACYAIMARSDKIAAETFLEQLAATEENDEDMFGWTKKRLRQVVKKNLPNPNSEVFALVSYAWNCFFTGREFDPVMMPSRMTAADRFEYND